MSRLHLALLGLLLVVATVFVSATPLDDYVHAPDPNFSWTLAATYPGLDQTTYVINLISQKWMTEAETTNPLWNHWLTVSVPATVTSTNALIYLDGGHHTDGMPSPSDVSSWFTYMAAATGGISCHLGQIPAEPITFVAEGKPRSEDAFIAYTWKHFLDNPTDENAIWLARMPMTKAAVNALTAVQQFVQQHLSGVPVPQGFLVAGASKRGWTTWTTMATDKRVIAAVPIVMDVLNMVKNLNHHHEAYGEWSFALADYVDMNVTHMLNTPQMQLMADIIDPYSYIDRFTMPKIVVCSCGDEFFLPDDPSFFWNELPGPKYLRMVPNAEHSLAGHATDVLFTIQLFYMALMKNVPMPKYDWTVADDKTSITVNLLDNYVPRKVLRWHAHNPKGRDFRLLICADVTVEPCIQPILWLSEEITPTSPGVYTTSIPTPSLGYAGYFIEIEYELGFSMPLKLTSEVAILPNTLPYPPCGQNC